MRLEFIIVSIFFNFYIILIILKVSLYLIFVFLTITVCEGALGVTLIIIIVRFYGNDYSNSLILLKW